MPTSSPYMQYDQLPFSQLRFTFWMTNCNLMPATDLQIFAIRFFHWLSLSTVDILTLHTIRQIATLIFLIRILTGQMLPHAGNRLATFRDFGCPLPSALLSNPQHPRPNCNPSNGLSRTSNLPFGCIIALACRNWTYKFLRSGVSLGLLLQLSTSPPYQQCVKLPTSYFQLAFWRLNLIPAANGLTFGFFSAPFANRLPSRFSAPLPYLTCLTFHFTRFDVEFLTWNCIYAPESYFKIWIQTHISGLLLPSLTVTPLLSHFK